MEDFITIRTGNAEELKSSIKFGISVAAQERLDIITPEIPRDIRLVKVTLRNWFNNPPTIEQINTKAASKGLSLCEAKDALYIRDNYEEDSYLLLGMTPCLSVKDGFRDIICLYKREKPFIGDHWADQEGGFPLNSVFIFRKEL